MARTIKLARDKQSQTLITINQLMILLREITVSSPIFDQIERYIEIDTNGHFIIVKPILSFMRGSWVYWIISRAKNRLRVVFASTVEKNWNREEAIYLTDFFKKYRYVQKDKTSTL